MENSEHHSQIQELEKTIRVLQKKLKRSEKEREQIESDVATKEALLKNVIHELQTSQTALQQKSQDLQNAMEKMKMMQVQLVHSEKMSSLGQVVAGVAHEINNPISFIHGNVSHTGEYIQDLLHVIELYQSYYPHPDIELEEKLEEIELDFIQEDLQKILKSMQVGTERIREIVKSLRIFSRLDEAEIKDVDLHEGLESTLMILQSYLKEKPDHLGIQVSKEYDQHLPRITCYSGQLNQVFMNLISNAIDTIKDAQSDCNIPENKGCIQIKTEQIDKNWVQISIADNGKGIPEEVRACIFNPFFTTKPIGQGTGLGLSISYQIIVEKHHGKLEYCSEIGKGTTFTIQIPVSFKGSVAKTEGKM